MTRKLTVSIVMATYNGKSHIVEQLDSLRHQTRAPDEVLIYDDQSSDGTYEFIQEYIEKYDLIKWKLKQNYKNQGWINNFYNLFEEAKGDIIFPSDQDDIWYSDKVEKMTQIIENNTEVMLLGGEVLFTDAKNRIKVSSKNIPALFTLRKRVTRVQFDEKFYLTRRPGCAIAFRRELITDIGHVDKSNYPHDKLLWNIAVLNNGAFLYNRPVIRQRRHNASAIISKNNQIERTENINSAYLCSQKLISFLETSPHFFLNEKKQRIISNLDDFFELRINMLTKWSPYRFLSVIKYIKYYPKIRTFFGDNIYLIKR